MSTICINVGNLRKTIKESQNQFKPIVFGQDETKKTNEKAYSDIKKETEKYDGGLTKEKKELGGGINATDNKGMHDLTYDNINKPFQDRVKSQMKGYVSKDAEDKHKNDEFGNATFDNDGKIYNAAKDHADAVKKGKDAAVEIGLTGRELNKTEVEKQRETMGESKKIKMLTFKNTQFISEGHMMTRIPDEYKKEGNKFIMKDSADNQYLVEWHANEPNVTKKPNMTLVNEQKERMKQLWGYKSAEAKTSTSSFRIQEDKGFTDMVNKARKVNDRKLID
jgi:hypothetical protein